MLSSFFYAILILTPSVPYWYEVYYNILYSKSYRLAGPNTEVEWAIEGRRLVPLMPRLPPQTPYTALASRMALVYYGINATMPPPASTALYGKMDGEWKVWETVYTLVYAQQSLSRPIPVWQWNANRGNTERKYLIILWCHELPELGGDSDDTDSEEETEGLRFLPGAMVPPQYNADQGSYTTLPYSHARLAKMPP